MGVVHDTAKAVKLLGDVVQRKRPVRVGAWVRGCVCECVAWDDARRKEAMRRRPKAAGAAPGPRRKVKNMSEERRELWATAVDRRPCHGRKEAAGKGARE